MRCYLFRGWNNSDLLTKMYVVFILKYLAKANYDFGWIKYLSKVSVITTEYFPLRKKFWRWISNKNLRWVVSIFVDQFRSIVWLFMAIGWWSHEARKFVVRIDVYCLPIQNDDIVGMVVLESVLLASWFKSWRPWFGRGGLPLPLLMFWYCIGGSGLGPTEFVVMITEWLDVSFSFVETFF